MGFNFTKKNLHHKCLLNSANFFRKGKLQKKKKDEMSTEMGSQADTSQQKWSKETFTTNL